LSASGSFTLHAPSAAEAAISSIKAARRVGLGATNDIESRIAEVMKNRCDKVYLGLGSNLGDRAAHLRRAVELIDAIPGTRILGLSSIYETQPRLYTAQPDFLNACARIETERTPWELLRALQDIEALLGRERDVPNGPRTVDLDVLLYGREVINEPGLDIPHPGLHLRGFVLVPLADVMGDAARTTRHPQLDRTIADLLADCPDAGWVRAFEDQRNASRKLSPTLQGTPK
jgi:2-amino-4-hydroxy-6-hydroxymethyldihydropteridine diphosphokinase